MRRCSTRRKGTIKRKQTLNVEEKDDIKRASGDAEGGKTEHSRNDGKEKHTQFKTFKGMDGKAKLREGGF